MGAPARKPSVRIQPELLTAEKRRPRTLWLTDSEFTRVNRLALTRGEEPGRIGRKALMLGVSMLESDSTGKASVAGGLR